MVPHLPFFVMNTAQTLLGAVVVWLLIREKELTLYWPIVVLALWRAPLYFLLLLLREFGPGHVSAQHAYHVYYDASWTLFAFSAVCSLLFTYLLFKNAMRPLKGLQSLGNIVFTWVAFISTLTMISVGFAPAPEGYDPLGLALSQLERVSALITISLVAFVALAIRPMGLSVRSRVFGTSIGTLLLAIMNAADSIYSGEVRSLYNAYAMVMLASSCIAQGIWVYYFSRPEPERNFVELPTTSPFHYWNDIARRLDQKPGVVAIGGFNPNALTEAEVEILQRASKQMQVLGDSQQAPATPLPLP